MFILVQKLQVNNMITVRNPRGWEWEKGGKEGRVREREKRIGKKKNLSYLQTDFF